MPVGILIDVPDWLDGAWSELKDNPATNFSHMVIYGGFAKASPSADTLAALTTTTHECCSMAIIEVAGNVDPSTPSPQGDVHSGTGDFTINLPGALKSASSVVIGGCYLNGTNAIDPVGSETELYEQSNSGPNRNFQAQYIVGSQAIGWNVNATPSTYGIAVEIAEASASAFRPGTVVVA